ncbi:hypothetical protein G7046_g9894 [Stylonectria norvegica]|nr:hypothetical protein G7046_g9894 [Stylonectria norvegica]
MSPVPQSHPTGPKLVLSLLPPTSIQYIVACRHKLQPPTDSLARKGSHKYHDYTILEATTYLEDPSTRSKQQHPYGSDGGRNSSGASGRRAALDAALPLDNHPHPSALNSPACSPQARQPSGSRSGVVAAEEDRGPAVPSGDADERRRCDTPGSQG